MVAMPIIEMGTAHIKIAIAQYEAGGELDVNGKAALRELRRELLRRTFIRSDLRDICGNMLKHGRLNFHTTGAMFVPSQYEVVGFTLRLRSEERVGEQSADDAGFHLTNLFYVFETDNWAIEICTADPDHQTVITRDLERFEAEICIIEIALANPDEV